MCFSSAVLPCSMGDVVMSVTMYKTKIQLYFSATLSPSAGSYQDKQNSPCKSRL